MDLLSGLLERLAWDILLSLGIYFIGKKAGMKKNWYSFIPIVRIIHLGNTVDRQKEARVMLWLSLLYRVINATMQYLDIDNDLTRMFAIHEETSEVVIGNDLRMAVLLTAVQIAVWIGLVIYEVRLDLGICKCFERRGAWVWLMIILQGPAYMLFGLKKSFVYHAPQEEIAATGAGESGASAEVLKSGLTVDITDRTVRVSGRERRLLRDIHLSIPRGHMVLLLGGSGAGKTTFLNAVTGYEPANARMLLDGRDIYKDYEKMKYDVGFVPQQDLMRGNDTVLRTLSDAGALRLPDNMNAKARKKRVQEVLEGFGLAMLSDTLVEKLSGGQRKRLSIAMEFISDPGLFILDEPDSGLDGVVARSLFEKLRAIADEGRIVIVITHTPDRVIDLFDDVIVLAKDVDRTGRLAFYGPIGEAEAFFEKDGMEQILLSINQKEEGGEGRANEFVARYAERIGRGAKQDEAEDGKAGAL